MPVLSVHPCCQQLKRKGWIVIDPWNDDYGYPDDVEGDVEQQRWSKRNRDRQRARRHQPEKMKQVKRTGPRHERVESRDGTFRCRQCKTIVGVPISGGRHRNHCPLCLYSRHVDRRSPGDRASACKSMMPATGLFTRRGGEQVLVHECLGCGVSRHNRIAADDNIVATMRLPVVTIEERSGGEEGTAERSA